MQHPSIAIVGGGPGGLALARILHQGGIPCTVFELDTSRHVRGQGGTLDIHQENGHRAIVAAGLLDEYKKIVRPEGDVMRVADKTGFLHIDETNPGQDRPEVDRALLRSLFLDSIPPEYIHWGAKVNAVTPSASDATYDLTLADGSKATGFKLVVGADGAWSRVRPLLTPALPFYSGYTSIEVRIANIDTRYPDIAKMVGLGSYFACGDNKALIAQRQGDGSVRTYAMSRAPETWVDERQYVLPRDKQRLVDENYADWSDANKSLVLCADDEGMVQRKLMMLPIGLTWDSRPGVTLVGDAAHLMLPNGEGVNIALLDALELGEKILGAKGDYAGAVKAYEEELFVRIGAIAEETPGMMEMMFADDAPIPFKKFMESHGAPPE